MCCSDDVKVRTSVRKSLKNPQTNSHSVCFQEGIIRKAELEDSLRARHAAWLEMQSEQRDHFLAFWKKYGDGGMATAWLHCSKATQRS